MEILMYTIGIIQGFIIAYIIFAPDTTFKRAFVDGLTLNFLCKRR